MTALVVVFYSNYFGPPITPRLWYTVVMELHDNDLVAEAIEQGQTDLKKPFSWQAPEGEQAQRDKTWYVLFTVVVLILIVLAIFVFKSLTFALLIPVMAAAVVLLSTKPPRVINYAISPKGVYVADKLYDFSEFRAFGVVVDEKLSSAILLPVRRFSPGLTIYFTPADGEQVVDMLGARLPMQEIKPDALDKFIRMIRL